MADEKWVDAALIGAVDAGNFDAKGDLLVGTADNTFDNLPVGANGEFLVPASTDTTGLRWVGLLTYGGQVLTKDGNAVYK